MIRQHEATIKKTNDAGIKMLLQNIVDDEKRHGILMVVNLVVYTI